MTSVRNVGESTGARPTLVPREVKLSKPGTWNGNKKDLNNFLFEI